MDEAEKVERMKVKLIEEIQSRLEGITTLEELKAFISKISPESIQAVIKDGLQKEIDDRSNIRDVEEAQITDLIALKGEVDSL